MRTVIGYRIFHFPDTKPKLGKTILTDFVRIWAGKILKINSPSSAEVIVSSMFSSSGDRSRSTSYVVGTQIKDRHLPYPTLATFFLPTYSKKNLPIRPNRYPIPGEIGGRNILVTRFGSQ